MMPKRPGSKVRATSETNPPRGVAQVIGLGQVGQQARIEAVGGRVGDGVVAGHDAVPERLDVGRAGYTHPRPTTATGSASIIAPS